tara:strand:+ start:845 stop:1078 length:234 start_codon:yes stop_codon:yes gene_type:complete
MKITKSQLKQVIKEEITNMNRSLGDFAQWVAEVDGHIESLSGESVSADELPSDVNLYDLWLSGLSPDQAAADLMGGA